MKLLYVIIGLILIVSTASATLFEEFNANPFINDEFKSKIYYGQPDADIINIISAKQDIYIPTIEQLKQPKEIILTEVKTELKETESQIDKPILPLTKSIKTIQPIRVNNNKIMVSNKSLITNNYKIVNKNTNQQMSYTINTKGVITLSNTSALDVIISDGKTTTYIIRSK